MVFITIITILQVSAVQGPQGNDVFLDVGVMTLCWSHCHVGHQEDRVNPLHIMLSVCAPKEGMGGRGGGGAEGGGGGRLAYPLFWFGRE